MNQATEPVDEELQTLCLFLTSGRTLTFRNVRIEHDNETAITFNYYAMSDGKLKRGVFYKTHVAGVSTLLR